MKNEEKIPQLKMTIQNIREWKKDYSLNNNYILRSYEKGDEEAWCTIISEAFGESKSLEDWQTKILDKEGYKPERVFFIFEKESMEPCATASAMRINGEGHGYLHYVGTRPKFAGNSLGYIVTAAVNESFKRDGCVDATLDTDPPRLAAIKTYLKLGYIPIIIHPKHEQLWMNIKEKLAMEFDVIR